MSENSADPAGASCDEALFEDLLGNKGGLPGRLEVCDVCDPSRLGISMPPPVSTRGSDGGRAGALRIGPSSVFKYGTEPSSSASPPRGVSV